VSDYGRIGARRLEARQIKAYVRRLQAFETAVAQEFSRLGVSRTKRVLAFWPSLRRSVESVRRRVSNRRRSGNSGGTE
jgi:hypothetical protein